MGLIYKIESPTHRIYIGQSVDFKSRLAHYRTLHCEKQSKLYNSFKKYGFNAHSITVLEEGIESDKLSEREIFYINKYQSCYKDNPKGMNMNKGGSCDWSEERRANFSNKFKGDKNPFFGKTHTEEMRIKFAVFNKEWNLKNGKVPNAIAIENSRKAVMRPVIVYDINGVFCNEYESLSSCAIGIGVPMGSVKDSLLYNCCIRKKYFVKYRTDNYQMKIDVVLKKRKLKSVIYFFNSYIIEFESTKDAAEKLGLDVHRVKKGALSKEFKPIIDGHIFMYKNLYEEIKMVS